MWWRWGRWVCILDPDLKLLDTPVTILTHEICAAERDVGCAAHPAGVGCAQAARASRHSTIYAEVRPAAERRAICTTAKRGGARPAAKDSMLEAVCDREEEGRVP